MSCSPRSTRQRRRGGNSPSLFAAASPHRPASEEVQRARRSGCSSGAREERQCSLSHFSFTSTSFHFLCIVTCQRIPATSSNTTHTHTQRTQRQSQRHTPSERKKKENARMTRETRSNFHRFSTHRHTRTPEKKRRQKKGPRGGNNKDQQRVPAITYAKNTLHSHIVKR